MIDNLSLKLPVEYPDDNACNALFDVNTGAFLGCPTVPNVQVRWEIDMLIPATYPAFSNTRVRCEYFVEVFLELFKNFSLFYSRSY